MAGRSPYVEYDRVAKQYRRGRALPSEVLDRWRAAVVPHLPDRSVRVVDVGAGTGMFAEAWQEWMPATVVAVEPNQAMIQAGQPGVRYVRGAAEQLPLRDLSVDVVWVSTALHHVADQQRAAAECARVLRDEGCVMVRTFVPQRTEITWLEAFPGRAKALARFAELGQLAELFDSHGLVVSHVREVLEDVQSFARSAEWVERMRHADSMLTAFTDDEIAHGVRALRAQPTRLARNELSLVVLRRRGQPQSR